MVTARILAPVESAGAVMELIKSKRGSDWQTTVMDDEQWMFVAPLPWAEVVTDFSDVLKNITSGFGSVDVSEGDPPLKEAQLTKVDICLNSEVVEPLAFVCHQDAAQAQARAVCQRLQIVLPRQQFVTVIQAKAGSKVIASERIKAYRKDVLTKSGKVVGGGDMTRKKKLLEKQKEGKKKMQTSGKVALSQEAFNSVISRS
jgi:GTP-binding protein LepA